MWVAMPRGDLPFWALGLTGVWKNKNTGHWLTGLTNSHSTLWELRSPLGAVITNQMDLPFKEELGGAPTSWADTELLRRKDG